jgi:hypothetical protein
MIVVFPISVTTAPSTPRAGAIPPRYPPRYSPVISTPANRLLCLCECGLIRKFTRSLVVQIEKTGRRMLDRLSGMPRDLMVALKKQIMMERRIEM